MRFNGLTVVIPTRNRARLAINAIKSVLRQNCKFISLIISDNSTSKSESRKLSEYCHSLKNKDVFYITPPSPMPMPEHWNWAMVRSLELSEYSHITYLTDRMLVKNDKLSVVLDIAKRYPDKIISYNHDKIVDNRIPIRLIQLPWTGTVFEIGSERLLLLVSRSILHNCLPRMLNTVVPRTKIQEIEDKFGNVFDSISPDFSFCFRVLETFKSMIFLDESILVHYALSRSNGESLARGNSTEDHKDFIENLGGDSFNFAAPVPQFLTVFNAICHEYCLLQEQTKSEKFPVIDRARYLNAIAYEVSQIENPRVRLDMEDLLVTHGWRDERRKRRDPKALILKLFSRRAVWNKLKWLLAGSYAKGMWLSLADLFAVRPPDDNRFGFQSFDEALKYSQRFPRRQGTGGCLVEPLDSARNLDAEGPTGTAVRG